MSTLFDDVLVQVDAGVDLLFGKGDEFSFTPMKPVVNDEPIADSSRVAVGAVLGIFSMSAEAIPVTGQQGYVTRFDTAGPRFSFVTAQAGGAIVVRRGDRFTRLKDSKKYEVTEVLPDGLGRVLARLKAIP